MSKKRKKLRGTVEKVIKPAVPNQPEKAQITIHEAYHLYREIRVDNVLTDEQGRKDRLDPGDDVDVTVEAEKEPKDTALQSGTHRDGSKPGSEKD